MSHRFKNNHYRSHSAKRKCNNEAFIQTEKLTEPEVGIREYINTNEGFSAVLKARYSDFHVSEINLAGEIAKLTDLNPPKLEEEKLNKEESIEVIEKLFPNTCEQIDKLLENDDLDPIELDVTNLSKEDRSSIHKNIKLIYQNKVVADTVDRDSKKFIMIRKYDKNNPSVERNSWPNNVGEYVHFLVYKECLDTMEACLRLSSAFHTKPANLCYAGVKDKRAKTTQWFSIKKYLPEKMVNKSKNVRNVHIGNFSFKDEPLKLGHLKGNRFQIALRNVTVENDFIGSVMNSLKENGFINYYGLQRFGCDKEVPTYAIGLKLLAGKWKEACELILKVKKTDYPDSDSTKAKRMFAETGNAKLALNEFSRYSKTCLEFKLLEGLVKNGKNDYVNALEQVPRNTRLLYIHSFQSLIWNEVVSKRIKDFGLKPIIGDLVIVEEPPEIEEKLDSELLDPQLQENNEDTDDKNKIKAVKVKHLTENDLEQYTIFDIVLPLPGYDIVYPENELKEYYRELLVKHNLSLEMEKQKVKTYNLSGQYRKILGKVENFSWKIMRYNNPEDVLIRSDYEELRGEKEPEDQPDGKFKALIMDFCLNPCNYATMVVREVLKTDTNTVAHAKLNNYSNEPVEKVENKIETGDHNMEQDLLSNKEKFEEFKKLVFTGDGENENCGEPPAKIAKSDD